MDASGPPSGFRLIVVGRAEVTRGSRPGHSGLAYAAAVLLNPTEDDRLRIFTAAQLARATLDRGLALNAPEAVALLCDEMHLAARGGASWQEVLDVGTAVAVATPVLDGVAELIPEIRLEVLLDEGTRLVVLREPFGAGEPGVRFGEGDVPLVPDRERRTVSGDEHRRAADPHVEPLPVLGREPQPRVRSRAGAGVPSGPAGGRLAALGAG